MFTCKRWQKLIVASSCFSKLAYKNGPPIIMLTLNYLSAAAGITGIATLKKNNFSKRFVFYPIEGQKIPPWFCGWHLILARSASWSALEPLGVYKSWKRQTGHFWDHEFPLGYGPLSPCKGSVVRASASVLEGRACSPTF